MTPPGFFYAFREESAGQEANRILDTAIRCPVSVHHRGPDPHETELEEANR